MVNKKKCPYCKNIINFEHKHINSFVAHCRNCKSRPGTYEVIEKIKQTKLRLSKRKDYKFNCKKCNKEYILNLTPRTYEIDKYRKHCTQNCANGHIQTKEEKEKRSKTILRRIKIGKIIPHHKGGIKGKLHPCYKENGCERTNREIKFKIFDKFKGICQGCNTQLIKKETKNWVAHHNNKHTNREEYYDDEDRTLYCVKCHASKHKKNISVKIQAEKFMLFDYEAVG